MRISLVCVTMPLSAPPPPASIACTPGALATAEVLAALSHALDLTEGQPLGHSTRACMIGMRLGHLLGLGDEALGALYYALLLKDAGCSSNAARIASLFGSDDQIVKPAMKQTDWDDRMGLAVATWRHTGMRASLATRMRHFMGIAREQSMTRDLIATRCERGADIARRLGFPEDTAVAIRSLDEHWNGGGHPDGLRGDAIPLLARILNVAQALEVHRGADGADQARAMLQGRRGSWFDPAIADLAVQLLDDVPFWQEVRDADVLERVIALDPAAGARTLDATGIDDVAVAFADIIDAKSPFTYRHSTGVAQYAEAIGAQMGLVGDALVQLRRAALLHDIGKLGVSNRILDKNGPLDAAERTAIEQHPVHTWEILRRVGAFAPFARPAALHHERLDGTGYPWGLEAEEIDLPSRILAVADTYEALTATRPYRAGLSVEETMAIVAHRAWRHLDPQVVDALAAVVAAEPVRDTL